MISIVYWSQTGNTQAMAEAISEGVTEAGKEAKIIDVTDASLDALKAEKVFALGCPAMGAEVLEAVAISCSRLRLRRCLSCDPARYCEIATSASGLLAMTNREYLPF